MKKKGMIVALIAVPVALPAAVYAASPLFLNTTIDEAMPFAGDKMMDNKSVEDATMADKNDNAMMEKQLTGRFAGASDWVHNAEGVTKVIYLEGENDLLRLEDFRLTNGPDLHVYLATDRQASDFVDLGRLKANNGNQNYDLPEGTDLTKYDTGHLVQGVFSVLWRRGADEHIGLNPCFRILLQ
jgi:electron transfer DM13